MRPFGERCWYCGSSGHFYSSYKNRTPFHNGIHIDHIIPTSCGGSNDLDNLALSCPPCNRAKSNLALEDFYGYLDQIRGHYPLFDPTTPHPTSSLFIKRNILS